jgi:hypothetical protein
MRTQYNEYMRNYMRKRRQTQREREDIRRALEREAVEYEARKTDAAWFPLMAGYKAAERGQPYDKGMSKDWRTGWSLWQRRHGEAA